MSRLRRQTEQDELNAVFSTPRYCEADGCSREVDRSRSVFGHQVPYCYEHLNELGSRMGQDLELREAYREWAMLQESILWRESMGSGAARVRNGPPFASAPGSDAFLDRLEAAAVAQLTAGIRDPRRLSDSWAEARRLQNIQNALNLYRESGARR